MNKPNTIFTIVAVLCVCLLSLTNAYAQTETQQQQAKPSYEIVLHLVTASNNAGDKSAVPQSLSNAVKKLKNTYSFSNYQVDSTYLERVTNKGRFGFSIISNETNRQNYSPVYTDWSFDVTESATSENGKKTLQFQNFRFYQKVSVKSVITNVANYEQVGLSLGILGLPENTPTVIGSLSRAKPDELMFLILTVKSAGE